MGERYERWRTRLRSDRVERIFGIILVSSLSGAVVFALVSVAQGLVWSAAWPAMATYALGSLVAGAAVAALVPRWDSRWMRKVRGLGRAQPGAIIAMWIPIGLFLSVTPAASFAETYVCERGDGILVQTSWTKTTESSGTRSGVYTHGGETYDIFVSGDEWLARQAGPEQPPTEDNPYYTRTYRVPWAGSAMICGNSESSDKNDMIGIGVMGIIGASLAVAALLELLRRRRLPDELAAGRQSSST